MALLVLFLAYFSFSSFLFLSWNFTDPSCLSCSTCLSLLSFSKPSLSLRFLYTTSSFLSAHSCLSGRKPIVQNFCSSTWAIIVCKSTVSRLGRSLNLVKEFYHIAWFPLLTLLFPLHNRRCYISTRGGNIHELWRRERMSIKACPLILEGSFFMRWQIVLHVPWTCLLKLNFDKVLGSLKQGIEGFWSLWFGLYIFI